MKGTGRKNKRHVTQQQHKIVVTKGAVLLDMTIIWGMI
jgi:hypothetical protein